MIGAPTSTLDLAAAVGKTGLNNNILQEKAHQGRAAEGSKKDLEDEIPQVIAHQARTPRINGASAAKETTPPLTPRTTRTGRLDTGSPEENTGWKTRKTYPFHGAAIRLMRSPDASAIMWIIRGGACPPTLNKSISAQTQTTKSDES